MQFGEPSPNAAVDAIAKGQMPPCILAGDVELFSVFEHAFIAIGRKIPHDELVAFFDLMAELLRILGRCAAHMRKRRLIADAFLHCIGDEVWLFLEQFALIGEFIKGVNDPAHCVAGGVIAADDQQNQIAHKFHRAHLVHGGRMDHHGNEVGRGIRLRSLAP